MNSLKVLYYVSSLKIKLITFKLGISTFWSCLFPITWNPVVVSGKLELECSKRSGPNHSTAKCIPELSKSPDSSDSCLESWDARISFSLFSTSRRAVHLQLRSEPSRSLQHSDLPSFPYSRIHSQSLLFHWGSKSLLVGWTALHFSWTYPSLRLLNKNLDALSQCSKWKIRLSRWETERK